jgi:hypothetical protein
VGNTVFWVDDETTDPVGSFLRDRLWLNDLFLTPIEVRSERDVLNSIEQIRLGRPELLIVDWQLQIPHIDGIDFAQDVLRVWSGPLLFLTRYPKKDELATHIDPRIDYAEVTKPDHEIYNDRGLLEHWYSDTLLPTMEALMASSRPLLNLVPSGLSFFGLTQDEFARFSLEDRISMRSRAVESMMRDVDGLFECTSAPWVVIVGSPPAVVLLGTPGAPPPSKETLQQFALRFDRIPICILRPASVNLISGSRADSATPSCGAGRFGGGGTIAATERDWFPSLQLQIEGNAIEIHFDTGSELSFFAYNEARVLGIGPELSDENDWLSLPLRVGIGNPSVALPVYLWNALVGASDDIGHLQTRVRMYLVHNFHETALALRCIPSCPILLERLEGNCKHRCGLLGRDILIQTGWIVALIPQQRRSVIYRPGEGLGARLEGRPDEPRRGGGGRFRPPHR